MPIQSPDADAAPSSRPPPTCAAATARRDAALKLDRPPRAGLRRLLDERGDAAGADAGRAAARDRRAARGGARRAARRGRRAGRGRRARLPQPVHGRRLVPRRARRASARRASASAPARAEARERDPGRVRERQPDRPDDRRRGAPRRLRRLAGAHPRASPATASSASTTSTTTATQVQRFGESIRARARGEEPPRTATRATTCASWRERIAGRGRRRRRRARPARDRADARGRATRRSSASACASTASSPSAALHEAGAIDAIERSSELEHVYEHDGRDSGCAPPRFGDDKDRVLRRSTGELTYFATDIAYHQHKLERGYDRADQRARAPTTTATSRG